ncbi:MAG TPA: hypothetical protein PLY87_17370, partial [Planctomycetaceae bacterium]|nr:hypothetical protein [Planctomycetaceae bacterium]
ENVYSWKINCGGEGTIARTRCSGGSCLPGFSLEAGASSALRSRAGTLERGRQFFHNLIGSGVKCDDEEV